MPPAPAKWVGAPWCEIPFTGGLAAKDRGGLHAGFGNRPKDAWAYSNAGVPPAMVLIIDPASRLVQQQLLTSSTASAATAAAAASAAATASGSSSAAAAATAAATDAPTATAAATAPASLPSQPPPQQQGAAPPMGSAWDSYSGLLAVPQQIDELFPLRCSEAQSLQLTARYAAVAAAGLPNGAPGRAYHLGLGARPSVATAPSAARASSW